MNDPKLQILYITGVGRSGSTLLGNLLGALPGFFFGGQLIDVWHSGFAANELCSCGNRFRACPLWSAVIQNAFGNFTPLDAREMIRLQNKFLRTQHLPLLLLRSRDETARMLKFYLEHVETLYASIRRVTNTRVIVDSSKLPSYGFALSLLDTMRVVAVHLVRDARGVAFAWQRETYHPSRWAQLPLTRMGVCVARWLVVNASVAPTMARARVTSLPLRYEDLLANPPQALAPLVDAVDKGGASLHVFNQPQVNLGIQHSIAGNPIRMLTGITTLKTDEAWRVGMNPTTRMALTLLTFPLLKRYGYALGNTRAPGGTASNRNAF